MCSGTIPNNSVRLCQVFHKCVFSANNLFLKTLKTLKTLWHFSIKKLYLLWIHHSSEPTRRHQKVRLSVQTFPFHFHVFFVVIDKNIENYDLSKHHDNIKAALVVKKSSQGKMFNKCIQYDYKSSDKGHMRINTVEKSQTNAISVAMHPLRQAIWELIWKHILAKSQISATNMNMHPLRQSVWGLTWKHTEAKSEMSAIRVTLHPIRNH